MFNQIMENKLKPKKPILKFKNGRDQSDKNFMVPLQSLVPELLGLCQFRL